MHDVMQLTQTSRTASVFSRLTGRGKKNEEELKEPPVEPATRERRKYIPGEDRGLVQQQMGGLQTRR